MGNLETNKGAKRDLLKKLTKPFTTLVIQLDKKIIEKIALGKKEYMDRSLVKVAHSVFSSSDFTSVKTSFCNLLPVISEL